MKLSVAGTRPATEFSIAMRAEKIDLFYIEALEAQYTDPRFFSPDAFRVRLDSESADSLPAPFMARSLHLEDLDMSLNFDFTPYRRSTVGFDRIFDLLETGQRIDAADGYPPFDIVKDGEDSYRITLAVAGFGPSDIEVVAQQNQLTVTGRRAEDREQGEYLHRGIAARPFERRFQLADFIEASNARFENGLLSIELKRVVPDAMKPRKIEIGGSSANDRIAAPEDKSRHVA